MNKKYVLFLILFGLHVGAMDVAPQEALGRYEIKSLEELQRERKDNDEFIIYSTQDNKGIIVKQIIWHMSETLKNIAEEDKEKILPLDSFSSIAIKDEFEMLRHYFPDQNESRLVKHIDQFSLVQFIDVINFCMFLDLDEKKDLLKKKNLLKIFKKEIFKRIENEPSMKESDYSIFSQLNADFVGESILPSVFEFLDRKILEKRKSVLQGPMRHLPRSLFGIAGFSADGNKVVSDISGSSDLIVWDISNVKKPTQQVLQGHSGPLTFAAFNHDGSIVVCHSNEDPNNLMAWDVATGNIIYNVSDHQVERASGLGLSSTIKFSYYSDIIVSGGMDGHIFIRNMQTGTLLLDIDAHHTSISSIALSSNKPKIVSGDGNGNVFIWNAKTGDKIHSLNGHANPVLSIAFSPDGNKIVSSDQGGNIFIWDAISGSKITQLTLDKAITFVSFNYDATQIVATKSYDDLIVWDINDLQNITSDSIYFSDMLGGSRLIVLNTHNNKVVVGSLNSLRMYDSSDLKDIILLPGHKGDGSSAISFSPDGTKIVAKDRNSENKLILWGMLSLLEKDGLKKCTIDQIILLCRLSLVQQTNLSDHEIKIFNSLPFFLQDLWQEAGLISKDIVVRAKKSDLFHPIIEDISPIDESEFIKSPGMKQEVLAPKKVPAPGRLQQWWEWFKNKPWKNIFGSAVTQAAGSGS